jgi:hypothetical protein
LGLFFPLMNLISPHAIFHRTHPRRRHLPRAQSRSSRRAGHWAHAEPLRAKRPARNIDGDTLLLARFLRCLSLPPVLAVNNH